MTLQQSRTGVRINRDEYSYPDPEIVIRTVTRLEDVRHLTSEHADAGMVYTYGDRDWKNNRTNYTGESKNAVSTRHTTTHLHSEWIKTINYPLVLAIQPVHKQWDTDFRRALESMLVYKKSLLHFKVANAQNSTWRSNQVLQNLDTIRHIRDIAHLILEHELFHLGLVGVDLNALEERNEVVIVPGQDPETLTILQSEMVIRNMIAKKKDTVVKGYELESGKVCITEVINLPLEPVTSSSAKTNLADRHAQLLAEAKLGPDGRYHWTGQTTPDRPGVWLSAAMGSHTSKDIWRDDETMSVGLVEVILPPQVPDVPKLQNNSVEGEHLEDLEEDIQAKYRSSVLYGKRNAKGEVKLLKVEGLISILPTYLQAEDEIASKHAELMSSATCLPDNARYSEWCGETKYGDPIEWIAAAVGSFTSNIWETVESE